MVRNVLKNWSVVVLLAYSSYSNATIFPLNVFRAWDLNLRPPIWCNTCWQYTTYAEFGRHQIGFNSDEHSVNELQIWQPTQNAIAMLQGFPEDSPETEYYTNVLGSPVDTGIAGNLRFTGDVDVKAVGAFSARYHTPYYVSLAVHVPLYSLRLSRVNFVDLTPPSDTVIREFLTDDLVQVVHQFDPELQLTGWSRSGVGDVSFFAEFLRSFPQRRECLSDVFLNLRVGVTTPTGKRKNENEILSMPFGFDGSTGLVFGGGIMLTWFDMFRAGLDVEFWQLFGNTRNRRIKIHENQTEFLFLAKVPAYTDYGFTQRYNLCVQALNFYRGATATIAYQCYRHGEDKLALFTNSFSQELANTAEHLQEWKFHQLIFRLEYDFQCDVPESSTLKPHVQVFYKLPLKGKRAVLAHLIGGAISLSF
jgi:hypothetical protein